MHNIVACFAVTSNMRKLDSFLWWCAGADKEILEQCPSEKSKYFGIGATVFFTGIFAALAGGYAIFTIFDNYVPAIGFSILWGLMIFNLDRYIVSSMKKTGRRWNEFLMAFPRIILAVIISIVIARPLELKIFEKEIESEIVAMQQEDRIRKEGLVKKRVALDNQTLKAEISELQKQIDTKEYVRDSLLRLAQQEADGTGGTGLRNPGPIYKIKKADADKVDIELQELRKKNLQLINAKRQQIAANDSLVASEISTLETATLTGLASRLEAMDRLTNSSNAVFIAQIFILLLFIAVETAPIFVKMIAGKGPYDYMTGLKEKDYKLRYYEGVAQKSSAARTRNADLNTAELTFLKTKLDSSLHKS